MKKRIYITITVLVFGVVLVGCDHNKNKNSANVGSSSVGVTQNAPTPVSGQATVDDFSGVAGEKVAVKDGEIELNLGDFSGNLARFYNTEVNGQTVYFFVVKDRDGVYRAAANGCQVCHGSGMGFRQEGDTMICNTCGNAYPIEKVATEKGGCNPGPINPDLELRGDSLIIEESDLIDVIDLF